MIGPPRHDVGADLEALARVPENATILEHLRSATAPRTRRNASPWDVDAFELHSHPDLTERLDELRQGVTGAGSHVGIYGYTALVDRGGAVRVVSLGNAGFAIRVADPAVRADIEANSRFRWHAPDPAWIGADPWPFDLPLAEGTARARSWFEASFAEAADPPRAR